MNQFELRLLALEQINERQNKAISQLEKKLSDSIQQLNELSAKVKLFEGKSLSASRSKSSKKTQTES